MKKRTVMHKENLNVVVKLFKEDFTNVLIKERNGVEYIPAGVLIKSKAGSEDIREKGYRATPITGTEKADGIIMQDVEFRNNSIETVGTVSIEGIAYLDKLIEVGKEFKQPLTITKTNLPTGITYIYKERK